MKSVVRPIVAMIVDTLGLGERTRESEERHVSKEQGGVRLLSYHFNTGFTCDLLPKTIIHIHNEVAISGKSRCWNSKIGRSRCTNTVYRRTIPCETKTPDFQISVAKSASDDFCVPSGGAMSI